MSPVVDIPRQIAETVAQAVATSSQPKGQEFIDVLGALAQLPGVDASRSPTLRYREYEILVGGNGWVRSRTQTLEKLRPLSLSVAPEVVDQLPVGEESRVLVTRYAACVGDRLLPAASIEAPFDASAVQRFRQDLQRLADHGFVHPFTRGLVHWMVGSETGTLVLNAWHAVQQGTPEECSEMLEQIDRALEQQRRITASRTSEAGPPPTAPQKRASRIREVFQVDRVLLPVIHPVSVDAALAGIGVAQQAGCKGVFLVDQGMSKAGVLQLVIDVRQRFPSMWVGVNLLGLSPADALVMALDACEGRIDGIWTDNAGIDERASTQPQAEALVAVRRDRGWNGLYFGGVAFKYQREVTRADLGAAARKAAPLMDVICTSGPGTGQPADLEKIRLMRDAIGPGDCLALASGVTASNVGAYLPDVDAFLVGTGLESAFGVLDLARVEALQAIVSTPTSSGSSDGPRRSGSEAGS